MPVQSNPLKQLLPVIKAEHNKLNDIQVKVHLRRAVAAIEHALKRLTELERRRVMNSKALVEDAEYKQKIKEIKAKQRASKWQKPK